MKPSRAEQERTVKKYSDDILRVLEAVNMRVEHLEASTERLAGTVSDLRGAVLELKDSNMRICHGVLERADIFQQALDTTKENVQVLKDKQASRALCTAAQCARASLLRGCSVLPLRREPFVSANTRRR